MSLEFDEIVQKIARSPSKVQALRAAPSILCKEAAVGPDAYGYRPSEAQGGYGGGGKGKGGGKGRGGGGGKGAPKFIDPPGKPTFFDKMYGRGGRHKILTDLTTQLVGASLLAGGALAIGPLRNEQEASTRESGKLKAQSKFKFDQVHRLEPYHEQVFKQVMKDDTVSKADKSTMQSAYQTMKRFAPNLAADENAALSFLREHAIYGTGPSYASLKNLADAERAIADSGGFLPE
jgi:hypothetical protein